MEGHAEDRLELPVEMELGKSSDTAHGLQVEISVQVPVGMIEHPSHPSREKIERSRHLPHPLASCFLAHRRFSRSTDLAV